MNRSPRRRSRSASVLCLAALCFPFSLAVAADPASEPASPAAKAAPAAADGKELRHGSRSKAGDGTLLIWDNVTRVFVTPERKDTYWIDESFYQYQNGLWLGSRVLAGPWELVPAGKVPEVALGRHAPLRSQVTARLPSGREAVYAPAIKAYKVAGMKGVFLVDAVFYRYDNGVWLASAKEEGPWAITSSKPLPQVMRRALPMPEAGQKVTLPSGETLTFEGEGNLYSVEGRPDTVYFDGAFYERRENKWFTSSKSASGFVEIPIQKVPGSVRTKYHKPDDPKIKEASRPNDSSQSKTASRKKSDAGAKPARASKPAPEAREAREAKPTADK